MNHPRISPHIAAIMTLLSFTANAGLPRKCIDAKGNVTYTQNPTCTQAEGQYRMIDKGTTSFVPRLEGTVRYSTERRPALNRAPAVTGRIDR
ncbi:hypothetical protein [Marichromatium bheemlicum]|uniref:DUF4124 domain-containing protein n=1 Tax=Marichromatium bheemlicum TaxID=365339 RepID=A0ABX1IBX7_9GAMM|nr:hypothetical protein [Marichromatium bheemlicum]NKN34529.1 hypothetical protein [Marichromatium bheemlicum]